MKAPIARPSGGNSTKRHVRRLNLEHLEVREVPSFTDGFEAPTLDPFWTVQAQSGSVTFPSAAQAHGVYETEKLGGVYDQQWPQWYAEHMTRTLAEMGYRLTKAET